MIKMRTVLVLGAGASRDYLMPTAGELREIIIGNGAPEFLCRMGIINADNREDAGFNNDRAYERYVRGVVGEGERIGSGGAARSDRRSATSPRFPAPFRCIGGLLRRPLFIQQPSVCGRGESLHSQSFVMVRRFS